MKNTGAFPETEPERAAPRAPDDVRNTNIIASNNALGSARPAFFRSPTGRTVHKKPLYEEEGCPTGGVDRSAQGGYLDRDPHVIPRPLADVRNTNISGRGNPLGLARSPRRGQRGFTLVEIALAVIVLALAITTAITALQRSFTQADTARNLEIAAQMLQCEMEKERLFTWVQLTSPAYVPAIDTSFARNPAISGRFTLSRSTSYLAGTSNQMLQVTLTVRWTAYDGHALTRSYTSYFTQRGLYSYVSGL